MDLQNEISSALKLKKINLEHSFKQDKIPTSALKEMAEELRFKNPMVNGFLNDAEYSLEGDTVTIELKNGGLSSLVASGFEMQYSQLSRYRFGKNLKLEFTGKTENTEPFIPPVIEHHPKANSGFSP